MRIYIYIFFFFHISLEKGYFQAAMSDFSPDEWLIIVFGGNANLRLHSKSFLWVGFRLLFFKISEPTKMRESKQYLRKIHAADSGLVGSGRGPGLDDPQMKES